MGEQRLFLPALFYGKLPRSGSESLLHAAGTKVSASVPDKYKADTSDLYRKGNHVRGCE